MMLDIVMVFAWVMCLSVIVGASYLAVSSNGSPGLTIPARTSMIAILVLTGQYLAGFTLLIIGGFGYGALIAIMLALSAFILMALRLPRIQSIIASDGDSLRALILESRLSIKWVLLASLGLGLGWLHLIRGILTPPMDWDFLTYHGTRAAFWALEGKLAPSYDAPGMWQIYKDYPIAADLLTGWAMALTHSDLVVALTWSVIWISIGLMVYVAVRSLGGSRLHATLGSLVALTLPASLHHMSSGYVDNAIAVAVTASIVCFLEAEKTSRPFLATIGLAGLGTAFAMKPTALPFLGLGLLLWFWILYRHRANAKGTTLIWSGAIACAIVLLWPAFQAIKAGNPLYPFGANLFGMHFRGPPDITRIPFGSISHSLDFLDASLSLFWKGFTSNHLYHNGLGLGALLLLLGSALSLFLPKAQNSRVFSIFLIFSLLLFLWILAFRINYPGLDHGRYLLAVAIVGIIAVARLRSQWAQRILVSALLLNFVYAFPWRWSGLDFSLILACAALGGMIAALAVFSKQTRRAFLLTIVLGAATSIAAATWLRSANRADYYEGAALNLHFNSGPISFAPNVHAYPAWEALSMAESLRIAVAAGTSPFPTHWFVYPLIGERFQHKLLYIPTGLYYPDELEQASSDDKKRAGFTWLEELRRLDVNAIMVYAPHPIEQEWIAQHERHFELVAKGNRGATALYLVRF